MESSYINKSLLTLGAVISKLAEEKRSSIGHIPFRDSKLTRILQSSLSGDAKITVICTLSPAMVNFEESLNTLKFARNVKKVVTRASKNAVMDDKALLQKYKQEIEDLKQKLTLTNTSFETRMEQERHLAAAERLKIQEEMQEQKLLRSALKDRIEHLTKMILTSTSVSNRMSSSTNSTDMLPALSATLSQMDLDGSLDLTLLVEEQKKQISKLEATIKSGSDDSLKFYEQSRVYEMRIAEKDDTIRELRFRVDDLTAKLYQSQWMSNIAIKNASHATVEVPTNDLVLNEIDALRMEVASERQLRKEVEKSCQERIAEMEAHIQILRNELALRKTGVHDSILTSTDKPKSQRYSLDDGDILNMIGAGGMESNAAFSASSILDETLPMGEEGGSV